MRLAIWVSVGVMLDAATPAPPPHTGAPVLHVSTETCDGGALVAGGAEWLPRRHPSLKLQLTMSRSITRNRVNREQMSSRRAIREPLSMKHDHPEAVVVAHIDLVNLGVAKG